MKNIKKFWVKDFNSTREHLNYKVGKQIPIWLFVMYYMIMMPIGILLTPIAIIYYMIKYKISVKEIFLAQIEA